MDFSKIFGRNKETNSSMSINSYLDRITDKFSPLKDYINKYLRYNYSIDEESLALGHRPWIAPKCYAITLFKPADKKWFSSNTVEIPEMYKEFLLVVNGCFCFELDLFGLPPSLQQNPPLLNRKLLQCYDLITANENWKLEYKNVENKFYFGSRAYSFTENLGYFITQDNMIEAILNNGDVINKWTDFKDFLKSELSIAEAIMKEEDTEERWN